MFAVVVNKIVKDNANASGMMLNVQRFVYAKRNVLLNKYQSETLRPIGTLSGLLKYVLFLNLSTFGIPEKVIHTY